MATLTTAGKVGRILRPHSKEYHRCRLSVPCLWLDVFQGIKSFGNIAISFSVDWTFLEGKPGDLSVDGMFALELSLKPQVKQAFIHCCISSSHTESS